MSHVNAQNNCDSTSICRNGAKRPELNFQENTCYHSSNCNNNVHIGISNAQSNTCVSSSCRNFVQGESNIQQNNCIDVSNCNNFSVGRSNVQSDTCINMASGYSNREEGDSNNEQHIACASGGFCENLQTGVLSGSQQNTACHFSSCSNTAPNSNVIANSASECVNYVADPTMLCQKDRSFSFANH